MKFSVVSVLLLMSVYAYGSKGNDSTKTHTRSISVNIETPLSLALEGFYLYDLNLSVYYSTQKGRLIDRNGVVMRSSWFTNYKLTLGYENWNDNFIGIRKGLGYNLSSHFRKVQFITGCDAGVQYSINNRTENDTVIFKRTHIESPGITLSPFFTTKVILTKGWSIEMEFSPTIQLSKSFTKKEYYYPNFQYNSISYSEDPAFSLDIYTLIDKLNLTYSF